MADRNNRLCEARRLSKVGLNPPFRKNHVICGNHLNGFEVMEAFLIL